MPPLRPEVLAALRAIKENPGDDTERLKLGDFLIDHGEQDRGEFIHAQCHFARLNWRDREWYALQMREQELLRRHRDEWLGPLRHLVNHRIPFERGLIWLEHPQRDLEQWIAQAGDRPDIWPWTEVLQVGASLTSIDSLLGMPFLGHVARLELSNLPLSRENVAVLVGSPRQAPLTRLDLTQCQISPEGIRTLASSPALGELLYLDLFGNVLGNGGAESLAFSTVLGRLTQLVLRGCGIGDAGAAALAQSSSLMGLSTLDLRYNRIKDDGARALALSTRFDKLTLLLLKGNKLSKAAVQTLQQRFGTRLQV